VVELDGVVVGYSRFDLDEDQYLISAAITTSMHGKGIGNILFKESIEQLNPQIPIWGEPLKSNHVSIKILERCGFKRISESDKFFLYKLIRA